MSPGLLLSSAWLQAIVFDHPAQQPHSRFDSVQVQVFVRLVRAGDITRAKHQRLAAKLLKIRRLGGEGHRLGDMTGEAFGQFDQLGLGRLIEGRHAGEQRGQVDFHLMPVSHRTQPPGDSFA